VPCGSTAYLALSDSVTTDPVHRRKKLIEVAIPLEAINAHPCEKSFRHGQPSTFHLWWARRPLAAARAGDPPPRWWTTPQRCLKSSLQGKPRRTNDFSYSP
jgi:hypothetical protein